jgi:hypothetical protein
MVQAIENWSDVRGKVIDVSSAAPDGFVAAKVQLEQVRPTPGYANLFEGHEGETIELRIRRDKAQRLAPGATIAARIRRAGPTAAYAHPDHWQVT